jgi:hypothetical protein
MAERVGSEDSIKPVELLRIDGVAIMIEPEDAPEPISPVDDGIIYSESSSDIASDSDTETNTNTISIANTDSVGDISALGAVGSVTTANDQMFKGQGTPTPKKRESRMSRLASGPLEFSKRGNDKPVLIIVFTITLLTGVIISQAAAASLNKHDHHLYVDGVAVVTMTLLSFIMIGVGCEFDIDKSNLGQYGKDYLIAMTAAGFPWNSSARGLSFASQVICGLAKPSS